MGHSSLVPLKSFKLATIVGENMNTIKIKLTPQQRAELLVSAKILDENGYYHKDFFSKETVEKSKMKQANAGR
jgi:hypothetical protein